MAAAPASRPAAQAVRSSLPADDPHRPRSRPRRSRRGRWRAAALIAVHLAVLVHLAHWKVAGATLSPLEPSEAMETFELGYVNAGFLLLAILILVTLVLGRFFCGWACHVVAYQDLCAWLLGKLGIRPRPVRSRLLLWVPPGAAFYMFAWPSLHRWWAGDPAPAWSLRMTTESFWETFPGPAIAVLTLLVDGFLVVYWLGAKGFCTYGCPYGALFGLADRVTPARIRVTDSCRGCGHCTAACTSNVRVHEEVARYGMVVDPGCMKCMDCISVCPQDALYYGFGRPSLLARRARRRPRPRSDFSWPEEIGMAVVFLGALYAFRSLYAQVPFLLAIGLAVLTAVLAVTGWRLVRQPSLRFQHRVLKADGRWTRAGWLAAAGVVLWLVFTAHSATVQHLRRSGEALALEGGSRRRPAAEREALLARSAQRLQAAARWGLVGDPRVHRDLGLVLRERGRFDEAAEHLRRALTLQPGWAEATVPLADLMMLRGEVAEAEARLRAVLREHPDLGPARRRLELLERGRAGDDAALAPRGR